MIATPMLPTTRTERTVFPVSRAKYTSVTSLPRPDWFRAFGSLVAIRRANAGRCVPSGTMRTFVATTTSSMDDVWSPSKSSRKSRGAGSRRVTARRL